MLSFEGFPVGIVNAGATLVGLIILRLLMLSVGRFIWRMLLDGMLIGFLVLRHLLILMGGILFSVVDAGGILVRPIP